MKRALLLHGLVLFTILCVALLPVFSVAIAGEIAEANNCDLDEGSVHPCIVNGKDIGETLYTLGMMGWFMIASIPLGLGAMLLYVIVVGIFYLARAIMRRRKAVAV